MISWGVCSIRNTKKLDDDTFLLYYLIISLFLRFLCSLVGKTRLKHQQTMLNEFATNKIFSTNMQCSIVYRFVAMEVINIANSPFQTSSKCDLMIFTTEYQFIIIIPLSDCLNTGNELTSLFRKESLLS